VVLPVAVLVVARSSSLFEALVPEHPVLLPVAELAAKPCTMMGDPRERDNSGLMARM
jgi:hypothetical protein